MTEPLYVGVDGGGTRTRAVVAGADLVVRGRGNAGSANAATNPLPVVMEAIGDAVEDALAAANVSPAVIAAISVGLAGVATPSIAERVKQALCARYLPWRVILHTDGEVTLAGVSALSPRAPAVALIGGTGTVALGRNARGEEARAGGWGPIVGDEGSGYAIGRRMLAAIARDLDGRGPSTSLREKLFRSEGLSSPQDLIQRLYVVETRPADVAAFTPLAVEAAREGDAVACTILREAAEELALSAVTVIRKLGMERDRFPVATVGGVFSGGELVLGPLRSGIAEVAPGAVLGPPAFPPELGAVRLALEGE